MQLIWFIIRIHQRQREEESDDGPPKNRVLEFGNDNHVSIRFLDQRNRPAYSLISQEYPSFEDLNADEDELRRSVEQYNGNGQMQINEVSASVVTQKGHSSVDDTECLSR